MTSLRDVMYNLMSELTAKQISTYSIMKNLDDRQSQLANPYAQPIVVTSNPNSFLLSQPVSATRYSN